MRNRIRHLDPQAAKNINEAFQRIAITAGEMHRRGVDPASTEAQDLADQMWQTALAFSGGDPAVLAEMEDLDRNVEKWEGDLAATYTAEARAFMNAAMEVWGHRNGHPFTT